MAHVLCFCRLVNRRVEQRQEHSITRTEITQQRRVLQEDMPQYTTGQPELQSVPPTNGHVTGPDGPLPMSVPADATLVSRTQKQQTTQQVTTVTKVVREVHAVGPDGQPLDYVPMPGGYGYHMAGAGPGQEPYPNADAARHFPGDPYRPSYTDYEHYPAYGNAHGQYGAYGDASNYAEQAPYGGLGDRPPTPPSPSERSDSPPPQQHDYLRKGAPFPQSGYDELDTTLLPPRADHYRITPSPGAPGDRFDPMAGPWIDDSGEPSQMPHGMRWRDPNLPEVIGFLSNTNNVIKANAAAYLQHLCYMDDPNKQKTRALGGIPPLVKLLSNESPDVYRNACGALRNLSYGRQNDENKRAIKAAGGIPALMGLLRKSPDADVKELVTGVLWNLSSCEDLKRAIIDDGLAMVVTHIIIPHSGWDPNAPGETCWSTVFRNASGVLRNVSSAGEYARRKLRECENLVDALLYVVRCSIDKANMGNKSVENCVCILRNLSYRCQEVEDPNYDKHPLPQQSRLGAQPKAYSLCQGENLGCFGASKKKKDGTGSSGGLAGNQKETASSSRSTSRNEPIKGSELLWQPEVVQAYLALLQSCSNPETLEAAAGAIQNLAACYWQPSIEIRAAVRKEKGLPILVELLRMEVDRVVCAVATALRNLAIDQRNKELIGKYAMRDLVQKLPSGNPQHDQGTSDDTIAAVLATLNEVIKKNAEFSRSLLEAGGVERLMNITRQRQKYTARVLKFAGQVLFTMWQHQELREVYKKHGWKEQDFVTKTVAARNAGGPNSPNNANSTLNRPMASQGGTRYEDRTIQRPTGGQNNAAGAAGGAAGGGRGHGAGAYSREDIPLSDMPYSDGGTHAPPVGGVRIYPPAPGAKPGEPLYAQVNREKKKNRQYEGGAAPGPGDVWGYEDQPKGPALDGTGAAPGGDSWV
ncbi:hypothetical protein ONE63_004098 [Megalurothrips usitatus]|uniref:Catenin delta-2 n=1 Tax=Megalurothrips usitatus TaxID=439358 RepID=A0AAV7X5T3_9NEOP|nr:hypothetical protein ONE63_004098 [Megalurothrips usitatus]